MIKGRKKTPINGFPCYEISETGIVYNLRRYVSEYDYLATLPSRIDRGGYRTVSLWENNKSHTKFLHRLLAECFVPNPENKPCVNHLNGKKLDCTITNLQWVSHRENTLHAHQTGLIKKKCGRKVIDIASGEVYESVKKAALAKSMNYATLKNYLKGKRINPTSLRYLK